MQNGLKCNERRRIWVDRTFKIEIQKGRPNNSGILQNWFPSEIRSPLFNLQKFEDSEKNLPGSCRLAWNVMDDEEFRSIELLGLKYRKGNQIIQTFCKIGSPLQIRPPLFNLQKFEDSEKSLPSSCRMDWNVMNDEELGSIELLRLKYRRGDQIIQTFYKIGSPPTN